MADQTDLKNPNQPAIDDSVLDASEQARLDSFNKRKEEIYDNASEEGKNALGIEANLRAKDLEDELTQDLNPQKDESGVPLLEENSLEMSPAEAEYQDLLDTAVEGLDKEIKYGSREIEALLTGAASSATLGLSDQALVRSGIYSQEELNAIRQANSIASGVGEVAGFFTPGAPIKAVTKGGKALQKAYVKAIEKASKGAGNKKAIQSILSRTKGIDAGSAVEGAAFATGQLISEQALGNAEFNAENFVTAAGQGLILGGALGTAFNATQGAVGFGVNAIGKGADALKRKLKLGQNADSVNSKVWQLVGASPADIAKFKSQNPELFNKSFKFFTDNKALKATDFTPGSTGRTMYAAMDRALKDAGEDIGKAVKGLDDVYERLAPNALPSQASYTQRILQRIDDEIIQPNRINGALDAKGREVAKQYSKYIAELRKDLANTKPLKPSQLHAQKINRQAGVDFRKNPANMTAQERVDYITAEVLRETVEDLGKNVKQFTDDANALKLVDDLLEANTNYRMASQALRFIPEKIQRAEAGQVIDPMTGMTVAMGVTTGNWSVTGAIMGANFLASEYYKKLRVLSYVEKANKAVDKSVAAAASNVVKKGSTRSAIVSSGLAKPATNNFLQSVTFDPGEKPSNDEKQIEAYKRLYEKMVSMSADNRGLEERLTFKLAGMGSVAPETTVAVMNNIEKSLNFLLKKAPKPPTSQGTMLQPKLRMKNFTPSDQELSKFARYLKATMNPGSILDSIAQKNVSTEEVEVMQALYPDLYNRVRVAVMDRVQEMDEELDYSSKLQLGILFNLPTDPSLEPKKVLQFQSLYGAPVTGPEPLPARQGVSGAQSQIIPGVTTAVKPTQGGLQNLEAAERTQSPLDKVINRS